MNPTPQYEGVERLDSYRDRATLDAYRAALLRKTTRQADFVERLITSAASVVEVACGNGRLLIELARRGVIKKGYGNDIACSRVRFAQAWASDLGLGQLRFEAVDVLETTPTERGADLACCITGALGYFEPIVAGGAAHVIEWLAVSLRPGGMACLEVYPHPEVRRQIAESNGPLRVWQELPADDPWQFYLSELSLNGNVLTHRKTFIHRTDGRVDSGRVERLLLYTPESLTAALEAGGFTMVRSFDGWTASPYTGGEILVATAKKRGR